MEPPSPSRSFHPLCSLASPIWMDRWVGDAGVEELGIRYRTSVQKSSRMSSTCCRTHRWGGRSTQEPLGMPPTAYASSMVPSVRRSNTQGVRVKRESTKTEVTIDQACNNGGNSWVPSLRRLAWANQQGLGACQRGGTTYYLLNRSGSSRGQRGVGHLLCTGRSREGDVLEAMGAVGRARAGAVADAPPW